MKRAPYNAELRLPKVTRKWGGKSVIERFNSKIKKCNHSGCWVWTGLLDIGGYAKFTVGKRDCKAHRFSFVQKNGPIPEGMTLDHLCRNRACVNPDHLEPVSLRENLLRGNTLQARNAKKKECDNGHLFPPENTRLDYGGWRQCKICSWKRKLEKKRSMGIPQRKYKGKTPEQRLTEMLAANNAAR